MENIFIKELTSLRLSAQEACKKAIDQITEDLEKKVTELNDSVIYSRETFPIQNEMFSYKDISALASHVEGHFIEEGFSCESSLGNKNCFFVGIKDSIGLSKKLYDQLEDFSFKQRAPKKLESLLREAVLTYPYKKVYTIDAKPLGEHPKRLSWAVEYLNSRGHRAESSHGEFIYLSWKL